MEGRTVGVGLAATTGFCAQSLDAPLAWRAVLIATADLRGAEIEAAGLRTDGGSQRCVEDQPLSCFEFGTGFVPLAASKVEDHPSEEVAVIHFTGSSDDGGAAIRAGEGIGIVDYLFVTVILPSSGIDAPVGHVTPHITREVANELTIWQIGVRVEESLVAGIVRTYTVCGNEASVIVLVGFNSYVVCM